MATAHQGTPGPQTGISERHPSSVPGKFFVDSQCLDCSFCRENAPGNFARDNSRAASYVYKQPETPEELERCREVVEVCCTEAVKNTGDLYNWAELPPPADWPEIYA